MRDILQSRYLRSKVVHKQLARTSLKLTSYKNILISCDFFLAHGFLKIVFLAKCCIFLFKCKLKIKII